MKDLHEVRNMRQVFDKGFFMGGALASAMTVTKGNLPPKEYPIEPNAERTLIRTDRAASYPAPTASSRSTSSRLSSSRVTGRATTSPATSGSSGTCRATSPTCG